MSRRLARQGTAAERGFTLVEVLVAVSMFAVAAAALLPLLIVSAKAAGTARLETQAKNLVQQQVERMRNLTFYVAHQNGDYVDLLDLYFTDVNTTARTITPTSTPRGSVPYQDADGEVRVQYLAEAGGTAGRPSGPAYRVSRLQFPGYDGFTLDVYSQFLMTTRSVVAPASIYDSQSDTADNPPTQLLGVTVIATWTGSSGTQTYRTYTEMADGRGSGSLLTTQARSTAVRVTGTDASGNNLLVQAGVVQADGSVTSASAATVAAEAARLEQAGVATELGQTGAVAAPPNPAGVSGESANSPERKLVGGSANPCGWASVGQSKVADVSATTGVQQPRVPADGGTDVRATGAKRAVAGVLTGGSGCSSSNLRYRPDADGLWSPAAGYGIDPARSLVSIPDTSGSGLSNAAVRAEGQVAATPTVTAPIFSSAYAAARTRPILILPVSGYSSGLVQAELRSSSVTCVSGQPAAAAYELVVAYPGGTSTVRLSDTSPGLPEPSTIAFSVDGVSRTLADYLTWSVATSVTEGNGVSTFGPVLRVTINKAVLGTVTDTTLEMGVLSCVAEDRR